MKRLISLALIAVGLGCATSNTQNAPKPTDPADRPTQQQIAEAVAKGHPPDKIRVCEYEEVLGTRIRQVTCRNLDQQEQDRAAALRNLQQMQQQAMPAKRGGG